MQFAMVGHVYSLHRALLEMPFLERVHRALGFSAELRLSK